MVDVAVSPTADERPSLLRKRVTQQNMADKAGYRLEGNLKFLNMLGFEAEAMCCRFNSAGKLLAVGLANGAIKIFSMESKSITYSIPSPASNNKLPVTSVRWKPAGKDVQQYGNIILAAYASGECRRWHVTTGKCLHISKEDAQLLACSYSSTGDHSIVSGSDGKIYLYDEETGNQIHVMEPSTNTEVMDGHVMRVFSVQYNPSDDHTFISGGWDGTIQWWDTRVSNKYSIRKISGPHICGESLDIEPSTMMIVAASWRKQKNLQIFDYGSGKEIKLIPEDYTKSMLYCAQWKDRDSLICGGSHSNMLRLVDYASSQTTGRVLNIPGAVYSMDHNRHGNNPIIAFCTEKNLFMVQDTL
ncbi:WD repeat-containing protein 5-like [Clytia hemisphaerica]|uniref:Anaphase-promoting complex subunit 4-like WD40 domain-containing protein n=1 Tax=Clytia hemisphaerica TaxID=252671 RepID=A0A7M5X677_9CNID|eukprot:TCONS_00005670-protein